MAIAYSAQDSPTFNALADQWNAWGNRNIGRACGVDGMGDETGRPCFSFPIRSNWRMRFLKIGPFYECLFSQGMGWHWKALRIAPDGLYCSKAGQETYFAYAVMLFGLSTIWGLQGTCVVYTRGCIAQRY